MKKYILLCLALLALCLSGCGAAEKDASLLFVIEEGTGFTVTNNAQRVQPGEDAVFLLQLEKGYALVGTDYRGNYAISEREEGTELRLRDARYPARVRLQLAYKKGQIRYEANGGAGAAGETSVVKSYSLTNHRRANTALGTELFARNGYTLVSWNTAPDGSGTRVGLGSRVTLAGGELALYAQWAKWSAESDFRWTEEDGGAVITEHLGADARVVIPASLGALPVRTIAEGAFRDCAASSVILPPGLKRLEDGAFTRCALRELTMFDDLADFSDESFVDCGALQTLYINAKEAPYGYVYRKESCYADKVDLLILNRGRRKLVFYAGCSIWYNLDGSQASKTLGEDFVIANLGLNGTACSAVQLQIIAACLEEGDVLFHTPELSSRMQLMVLHDMREDDSNLWCGLENNYDLFALVDLRTVGGVFDSFCHYLSLKDKRTDYNQFFSDDYRTPYVDQYGCIPFYRSVHAKKLGDIVNLRPELLTDENLATLREYYAMLQGLGTKIYVSSACLNVDALPEGQAETIEELDARFREAVASMGATPISRQTDYLYHNEDFYDTNYHLLSESAKRNTALWLRDLGAALKADGLWEGEA